MQHSTEGDWLLSLAIIVFGVGTVVTLVAALVAFALNDPRARYLRARPIGLACGVFFLAWWIVCLVPASQT